MINQKRRKGVDQEIEKTKTKKVKKNNYQIDDDD